MTTTAAVTTAPATSVGFTASDDAPGGLSTGVYGTLSQFRLQAHDAFGNAVLDVMLEPGFLAEVERKGLRFKQLLAALKDENPDLIEEVRGVGLLAGLRLKPPAADAMKACTAEKLLTVSAGDNVLRMLPSLTVTEDELKEGIARLSRAPKSIPKTQI